MMTESEVLNKIHLLPRQVQQHLFLYVDFLFHAYASKETGKSGEAPAIDFFTEHELTETGKQWLEQRAEEALTHPEKRLPWKEAREKIHQKHNLAQ